MKDRLRDKFIGCMLGSALGDAVGELAFRYADKRRLISEIEAQSALRYTDDTAMAVGLAESIAAMGDVDPQHLGRTFHENFIREPFRGYASGPPTVFAVVESTGVSYSDAAAMLFEGKGSLGNGAVMRVHPVGLYYCDSESIREKARASAQVTHSHILARDGAALQALATARAVGLDPREAFPFEAFCEELMRAAETLEMRDKIGLVRSLVRIQASDSSAADALGRTVAVHESWPFALYSFVRYPASFEECLYCAILNGGDRDTLGAMASALSGAYLGVDALPRKWMGKIENREMLERLALSLLH